MKNPPGSNNTFPPSSIDNRSLMHTKFDENCLKLNSNSLHQNVVNLHISYILVPW